METKVKKELVVDDIVGWVRCSEWKLGYSFDAGRWLGADEPDGTPCARQFPGLVAGRQEDRVRV